MDKYIGVIGAGMMGTEISLCFAQHGFNVFLNDVKLSYAENGKSKQNGILDRKVKKGYLTDQNKIDILNRVIPTGNLIDLKNCDLIIEAAFEKFEVKKDIFVKLDTICKPECVFASNTSSIPITKLASCVNSNRVKKFLGMHFFSPASVMKLVEVIPGLLCEADTLEKTKEFASSIGKTPIVVKDVAGFAVNRLFNIFIIEAMRLYEEGVASPEDIDTACKLGLGHPMGPFELLDMTSLDLNLSIHEVLFKEYGDRFRPRPILRKMVNAGLLGKKVGQGFYKYDKDNKKIN